MNTRGCRAIRMRRGLIAGAVLQRTPSIFSHFLLKRSLQRNSSVGRTRRFLQSADCTYRDSSSKPRINQASPFLISLERSIGARNGLDKQLWSSGSFSAEVYPDLPVAARWADLFKTVHRGAKEEASKEAEKTPGRLLIRTLGCQTRSSNFLRRKLLQAAEEEADGVLLLSGSHPAHRLASWLGWTPSSFNALRMASKMRQQGELPATLDLWAVENPLLNPAARLEQKYEAGATVVLTQPPLLWDRFESWWSDIQRNSLTEQGKVVVGIPMLTSSSNLRFWLYLCGAANLDGAADLQKLFREQEAHKDSFAEFTRAHNRELIQKVLNLPGVAGLHMMPLTKGARQQVLDFQQHNIIPSPVKQF